MNLLKTVNTLAIRSPLAEILHLLQSYLLPLPALVLHYEFWVVVEHGVLAFGQWSKVREQSPGMDVSRCAAHEPVSLLYHGSQIQVVTMVEEILRGKETGQWRMIRWGGHPVTDYGSDLIDLPQSPLSGSRAAEAPGSR